MPIYVIIGTELSLKAEVESLFPEEDRSEVATGVWFVRSEHLTSSDIVSDLEIKVGGKSGIVVAAKHYDGVADRGFIEKLEAWENMP